MNAATFTTIQNWIEGNDHILNLLSSTFTSSVLFHDKYEIVGRKVLLLTQIILSLRSLPEVIHKD